MDAKRGVDTRSGKQVERRWAVEPKKHRAILKLLRHGVGIRSIAQMLGVGVRTVQRRKEFLDQETSRAVIAEDGGGIDFAARGGVCEVHGAVSVWPCVACAARAAKNN